MHATLLPCTLVSLSIRTPRDLVSCTSAHASNATVPNNRWGRCPACNCTDTYPNLFIVELLLETGGNLLRRHKLRNVWNRLRGEVDSRPCCCGGVQRRQDEHGGPSVWPHTRAITPSPPLRARARSYVSSSADVCTLKLRPFMPMFRMRDRAGETQTSPAGEGGGGSTHHFSYPCACAMPSRRATTTTDYAPRRRRSASIAKSQLSNAVHPSAQRR